MTKRLPTRTIGLESRRAMLSIALETPYQEEVLELLQQSDAYSASLYPVESRHPIDADALSAPEVRFLVARLDGQAVGCGVLVLAANGQAELKRMFVDPVARGRGVGLAILQTVEETAWREGMRLIQLETGVGNREALGLYLRCGYREREPFGSYGPDPLSVFMEKDLHTYAGVKTVDTRS
jgi:putative acetyltransferase